VTKAKGSRIISSSAISGLFFEAPDTYSANDAANYIARNMISLTFGATPAELTSLEQLLSTMMHANHISEPVVTKLWQVYGVQRREISKSQRRGSIIVLGMLATAKPRDRCRRDRDYVTDRFRCGLGRSGLTVGQIHLHSLRRINASGRHAKTNESRSQLFQHLNLSVTSLYLSDNDLGFCGCKHSQNND